MSSNKGKDGELQVLILVANIGIVRDGVDVTRPTTTNTADQGADLFITHLPGFLNEFAEVSGSDFPSTQSSSPITKGAGSEKSRVDVKTTDDKLQKDTVEKFIEDCHNHPNCKGHILMGGLNLTGPAKREFQAAQNRFSSSGKILLYVKNDGVQKLEAHYRSQIEVGGKKDTEPPDSAG